MATKEKGQKKAGGGAEGGASRQKGRRAAEAPPRPPHSGVGKPVPPPRMKAFYAETVAPKLMQQFSLKNKHQVPTLSKIVINCGVGEAIKQPKVLDKVVEELGS